MTTENQTEEQTEPTVAEQIAEAEAQGDWGRVGTLKFNQHIEGQLSRGASLEQPGEAEAPSEETTQKIAELESEGKWTESIHEKLKAAGMTHYIPQ